jgi:hypothetical protein
MGVLRARVAWLAALTLTFQVGVIVSASAALCCLPQHPSAAHEMACCKESGGAPHVCQLKKAPKPDAPVLKACCSPDQQIMAALFALVGVPEPSFVTLPAPAIDLARATISEQVISLLVPPDSPPPRA